MWLLDVNMPKKVVSLLGEFGIKPIVRTTEGGAASLTGC
jgi:hypothetical protein